ncbi:hypothetical protein ACWCRF_03655 [Streptomyces sp. NPDC002405]
MDVAGIAALPYVDEHATVVAADTGAVWRGLGAALEGSFCGPGAARYARLVGCADRAASGPRPLAEGSTLPGFRGSPPTRAGNWCSPDGIASRRTR